MVSHICIYIYIIIMVKKMCRYIFKPILPLVCHKGTDRKKSSGLKCWGDLNSLYTVDDSAHAVSQARENCRLKCVHVFKSSKPNTHCLWALKDKKNYANSRNFFYSVRF